jgi:spore germination protein YaaH
MFTNEQAQTDDFKQHAKYFQVIHPVWYALESDGVTLKTVAGADDQGTLSAAKSAKVQVMPTVASVDNPDWTRAMLGNATTRKSHVQTLVELAKSHKYAGLDLDYEKLEDADAANLLAFVNELTTAMHAAGREVSMAVPALDHDSPVWNYDKLSQKLDHLHLMGYDFHTVGSSHDGPTAPVGWIEDVATFALAHGDGDKFILGMPNYGVTTVSFCASNTCASKCTGPIAATTDHMKTCPLASYPGQYTAGRSLNCDTPEGRLFFDDTKSLEEKVKVAQSHALGGVAYWNVGGEPDGFFDMVRKYYPDKPAKSANAAAPGSPNAKSPAPSAPAAPKK